MTSTDSIKLLEVFHQKNLVFQPDYPNVDPSKHYRYCSILNLPDQEFYHRDSEGTKTELVLKQKWRPNDEKDLPNPHYLENKSHLENYLKEYKNGGIDLLEKTILDILNNDEKKQEKFESLPGLRKYFKLNKEQIGEQEIMEKFANVVRIALRIEDVLPERIYRLVDDVISATFSQEQCAVLLAWMFFDSRRNQSFLNILNSTHPISVEKIKFLLHYFDQITTEMPRGNVSFMRIKHEEFMKNEFEKNRNQQLQDVTIFDDLLIEETALCTQVDFANKHIGGGVLRLGGVQEEIRFLMCPEMIVSMLLFDRMESDEAISIVGAQVFSSYSGYSGKLKWRELDPKDALQNNPDHLDQFGRLQTEALAINAIKFFGRQSKNMGQQLEESNLIKELVKSGVGFSAQGPSFEGIPVVSGWWGCGAYNGNKPLKFLIQLMASSIARRPLYFCTFGESIMGNKCVQMKRRLEKDRITVGQLYDLLLDVPKMEVYEEMHVFDSIEMMLCRRSQT